MHSLQQYYTANRKYVIKINIMLFMLDVLLQDITRNTYNIKQI